MTYRIYEYDGSVHEFEAVVTDCREADEEGLFRLTLDRTAFFPGGGGQEADEGSIGGVPVNKMSQSDGEIYHYTTDRFTPGERVNCVLDKRLREARMQAHTGEHIVSGTVHSMFGYDNVGFHMGSFKNGDTDVTVDFNGTFTDREFAQAERNANLAVLANLPVTVAFPSPGELTVIPYRSKKELTGAVRIVTIKDTDICACCAPHLAFTGQVGLIKLLDRINWKGGTRLHIRCGMAALDDYNEKYVNNKAVAEALTVKQNETAEAFTRFAAEAAELKRDIAGLRRKNAVLRAGALEKVPGNLCIFEEDMTADELRLYINCCVEKCGGICAGFVKSDEGWLYVIESKSIPLRSAAKEINAAVNGRGGGSDSMLTGKATADRNTIETFFTSFCKELNQ